MFILSVQNNFYVILSSYVEAHVIKKSSLNFISPFGFQASKIWMFFGKIFVELVWQSFSGRNKSLDRAWKIENLDARFFVYANTGLHTCCACSQFRARELPVCACVEADCVCHRVRDYVLYINIFLVLYYLTLYFIKIWDSCFSSLTTDKVSRLTICLETVKLTEYRIKEIDRELFEIEVEHFESSILFKIVVKWADQQ